MSFVLVYYVHCCCELDTKVALWKSIKHDFSITVNAFIAYRTDTVLQTEILPKRKILLSSSSFICMHEMQHNTHRRHTKVS